MKDYMASGSFARGKEEKAASASMVFVGNVNQNADILLKTSSLFDPFPPEMGTDTAFLDRMHCYLPGWEIPKFRPGHFTYDYGFITDYLAEFLRELRNEQYGDICSIALGKPTLSSLAVLGKISISGTMMKVEELANALQVCVDSGSLIFLVKLSLTNGILIADGITLALEFITGEPFVQRGNLGFRHSVCLLT